MSFSSIVNLSSGLQDSMFNCIQKPTHRALEHCIRKEIPISAINLCGGVACNNALFSKIEEIAQLYNLPLLRNSPSLCTDNAVMIAWMGWELINSGQDVDLMSLGSDVIPLTSIPLGSYADDYINIKGKTLRLMRQMSRK